MAMVYVGAYHVPPREFLAAMLSAAHPGVHDFASSNTQTTRGGQRSPAGFQL